MESNKDMVFASTNLELDLTTKHRMTKPASIDSYFSSSSYQIVNSIYKDDFLNYNYHLRK
jgi:hypothetical protein